jgi:hypothetical protein
MARRDLRLLLGLTGLTLALVAVQALTGAEVLLAWLAARFVARVRRAVPRLMARLPRAPRALLPRGGRLLACSLAERGPPAVLAAR